MAAVCAAGRIWGKPFFRRGPCWGQSARRLGPNTLQRINVGPKNSCGADPATTAPSTPCRASGRTMKPTTRARIAFVGSCLKSGGLGLGAASVPHNPTRPRLHSAPAGDHHRIRATPRRPSLPARWFTRLDCACSLRVSSAACARLRSLSHRSGEAALPHRPIRHRPIRATPCRLPSRQSTGFSLAVHRLFHWLSTVPPVVAFGTTRHWPVLSCGSCSCPGRHTTARPGRRPHTRSPMRPVPPNSARLIILALVACVSG
jgi:hypothetical protein